MKRLMIGLVLFMMIACSTFEKEEDSSVIICPRCNSDSVAQRSYGLIDPYNLSPELKEKVRKREVILRGCIAEPENCHCNNCGYEWEN